MVFGAPGATGAAPGAFGAGGSEQPAGAAAPQPPQAGAQSQLECLRLANFAFRRSSRPGLSQSLQPLLQPVSLQLVVQPWKTGLLKSGVPQAGLHFGAFSQPQAGAFSQPQELDLAKRARILSNRLAFSQELAQVGPQPPQPPPQPVPVTTAGAAATGAAPPASALRRQAVNRRAFTGQPPRRTLEFLANSSAGLCGSGRAVKPRRRDREALPQGHSARTEAVAGSFIDGAGSAQQPR